MKTEATTQSRIKLVGIEYKRCKQELVSELQNEKVDIKKATALLTEITQKQTAIEWMEWSRK